MNKYKAIQVMERYKNISRILNVREDEQVIDDIIEVLSKYDDNLTKTRGAKKTKAGEEDFYHLVSKEDQDLSEYGLSDTILSNKETMLEFWDSLSEEEKADYTIFELNVILYLISNQYNKYQKKDRKKIQSFIDTVVRDKKMESSYQNIKV